MQTPSDPYAELGIPRDATQAQINRAFRRLLRRYHPDTRDASNPGSRADSDSALQRVLAAYSSLHEVRATTDRPPETTAPPVVQRSPWDDAPIRAGPIRWGLGTWP